MQKSRKVGKFSEPSSNFVSEENFILKIIEEFSERLRQNYNYSNKEIINLFEKVELLIPIEIFSSGLAPAEALTKFLKENCDKNFHEISLMIKRNEKSIWQNYHRAIKKMPSHFAFESKLKIPVSAFGDNKLSVFECLIFHLKEQKQLKNIRIAHLLGKNPSNVWSVYSRAMKKLRRKK